MVRNIYSKHYLSGCLIQLVLDIGRPTEEQNR